MATNNAVNVGLSGSTGSGSFAGSTSPSFTTPILGTPTSGTLSSCTGYPIASVTGLGTNMATWLATPSSANLASTLTDEVGTGNAVFETDSTFTPVLNFGAATTGITYGTQLGFYSRVGNVVIFTISIVLTSKGSAVGNATITGLPVATRASTTNNVFLMAVDTVTFTGNYVGANAGSSATAMALLKFTTAAGQAFLTDASFANTSSVYIAGSYLV